MFILFTRFYNMFVMIREFPSKEWIIDKLVTQGIEKPIALWLVTNLVPVQGRENERGDVQAPTVGWGFDLDTILGN